MNITFCLSFVSTYYRMELEKTIKLMAPRQLLSGKISYGGSSQMGIPVLSFRMEEVLLIIMIFLVLFL